jgi:hypothetical protein
MLQAGRSRVPFPMRWIFSIDLVLPTHYGPGVDSVSNRNEYQEYFWGVKGGRRVSQTNLPPSVSRLSKENVGASTSHNPMGFLIYTQSVGLLGQGISPLQGRYLCTEGHKHRINAYRYLCLELDSNPRSHF